MRTCNVFSSVDFLSRAERFIPIKFINMNWDKLLIIFVAFCTIGFGYTEAYNRNVCQFNVQVPYTRKVNKTELKPFEENTYNYGQRTRYREVTSIVEETAYKFEIQSKCCPGFVGPIENCQRTSTTSQDITSLSIVSALGVTKVAFDGVTESSTRTYHVMESSTKSTETPSDNTKPSEYSVAAQTDNTTAVTDAPTAIPETTTAEINTLSKPIATKVDWLFPIWFFCILVLVAFVAVLVKVLVHRNDRRAYVVNKKCASTESHC